MALITLNNVGKNFGTTQVLHDIHFEIDSAELVVLAGPNGAGKSTLLRILCGLEKPSQGEVLIDGQPANDWSPLQRGVAMVFQNYALYPHMNVQRNITFGLPEAEVVTDTLRQRIGKVTKSLGIDHLLHRMPREISSSQRHRVAIARAVVRQPRLFLFDEPPVNMDRTMRAKNRTELILLHRSLSATMVCVTHDQSEAMAMGSKIVVLHEGRVQQIGTPSVLYQQPVNRFVATYIGAPTINLMPARVLELNTGGVFLRLINGSTIFAAVDGNGLQVGESVELGLRPEHCKILPVGRALVEGDIAIDAQIMHLEHFGDSSLVYLKTDDGQPLVSRTPASTVAEVGTSVIVCAAPQSIYMFKTDGTACPRLHPEHAPIGTSS